MSQTDQAAAALDFALDPQALGDGLFEKLDALRAAGPIFWSEQNRAWIVTGHEEVLAGFYGKLPLSANRLPHLAVGHIPEPLRYERFPNLMEAPKAWLLNMDDPEHQRIRRLVQKAFSRPVVESLRPDVRRYVEEALDRAAGIDGAFDFVAEVARLIPGRMILKVLGLGDELIGRLHHWSILLNSVGNINVPLERLEEIDGALVEMRQLFEPEYEKRRQAPCGDFLSALVTATEDGDQLSNDEMFGICVITLIAGHDTTANTIALGVAALAREPGAADEIRARPDMVANAVMELQRKVMMSTLMSRVVAEDFEWAGHQLRAGDFVLLAQGAANRDPAIFPEPDRIDLDRRQTQNLVFAPGLHHCIGHLLAKMVLGEFFPEYLRRFDAELVDKSLLFGPTISFRGLDRMQVRLKKRPAG
ncbi:cytochrome P450 [Sphingosinicella terrae]|uniref:cytochrome P450 n=1 Tax=Sphingosinicella terrae TaxID=2172047 RepID=UPI0013B365CF|nr:cytochrome P450 [Sphingosinicella terrae]